MFSVNSDDTVLVVFKTTLWLKYFKIVLIVLEAILPVLNLCSVCVQPVQKYNQREMDNGNQIEESPSCIFKCINKEERRCFLSIANMWRLAPMRRYELV